MSARVRPSRSTAGQASRQRCKALQGAGSHDHSQSEGQCQLFAPSTWRSTTKMAGAIRVFEPEAAMQLLSPHCPPGFARRAIQIQSIVLGLSKRLSICALAALLGLLSAPGWAQNVPDLAGEALEHARANTDAGIRFEHGEGHDRDFDRAHDAYCRAARAGYGDALVRLGWMYANGRGVPNDDAVAHALFQRAAGYGHAMGARLAKVIGKQAGALPLCLGSAEDSSSTTHQAQKEDLERENARLERENRQDQAALEAIRNKFRLRLIEYEKHSLQAIRADHYMQLFAEGRMTFERYRSVVSRYVAMAHPVAESAHADGAQCFARHRKLLLDPRSAYIVESSLLRNLAGRFVHVEYSARNGLGGATRGSFICSVKSQPSSR